MTSKKAHEIIRCLSQGYDPFGLNTAMAGEIPATIAEAWSPEKKDEITAKAAASYGKYHIVDHVVAGDYDLVLWHTRTLQGFEHAYLVSLNNGEHDPMSPEAQQAKQPDGSRLPLQQIKLKLKDWVEKYGTIIVGSFIPERNDLYRRLVQKLLPSYKLSPFYDNDFKYGFKLEK